MNAKRNYAVRHAAAYLGAHQQQRVGRAGCNLAAFLADKKHIRAAVRDTWKETSQRSQLATKTLAASRAYMNAPMILTSTVTASFVLHRGLYRNNGHRLIGAYCLPTIHGTRQYASTPREIENTTLVECHIH